MTVALVSANLGGIDPVLPIPRRPDVVSTYYTDRTDEPLEMLGWSRVVHVLPSSNPRLASKLYKCQINRTAGADEASWYLWLDASLRVKSLDFVDEWKRAAGKDGRRAVFLPHPWRRSPGEEFEYILEALRQGNTYLASRYTRSELECERDHFARRHRLFELPLWCGGAWMLARSERTEAFLDAWWYNVRNRCVLDQAAISPLLVEAGVEVVPFKRNVFENEYWTRFSHA